MKRIGAVRPLSLHRAVALSPCVSAPGRTVCRVRRDAMQRGGAVGCGGVPLLQSHTPMRGWLLACLTTLTSPPCECVDGVRVYIGRGGDCYSQRWLRRFSETLSRGALLAGCVAPVGGRRHCPAGAALGRAGLERQTKKKAGAARRSLWRDPCPRAPPPAAVAAYAAAGLGRCRSSLRRSGERRRWRPCGKWSRCFTLSIPPSPPGGDGGRRRRGRRRALGRGGLAGDHQGRRGRQRFSRSTALLKAGAAAAAVRPLLCALAGLGGSGRTWRRRGGGEGGGMPGGGGRT